MTPAESTTIALPLLVTRALVVFPNMSEEIEVARPFSVVSVEKAKKETNNLIFIVTQRDAKVDNPNKDDIYAIGTMCRIVSYAPMGEKIRIRVVGSKRARLFDVSMNENGCYATGELLESTRGGKEEEMKLSKSLVDVITGTPGFNTSLPHSVIQTLRNGTSSDDLPDAIASYFGLTIEQKQKILEETNLNNRLSLLLGFINDLKGMSEVENNLNEKVRESSEKAQKEYYLREKMKAIKEELGEDTDSSSSPENIREKLAKNPYPENIKKRVEKELKRYELMPESSLESSLIMNYIETLMGVPWFEKTEDNESLDNVRKVLDEDHYGLEKVKKRIIEYLAVKKMTGNLKAPILCFYGPPGCGLR